MEITLALLMLLAALAALEAFRAALSATVPDLLWLAEVRNLNRPACRLCGARAGVSHG